MPSMPAEHCFIHTAAGLHAPNKSPTAVLLACPGCGLCSKFVLGVLAATRGILLRESIEGSWCGVCDDESCSSLQFSALPCAGPGPVPSYTSNLSSVTIYF